MLSGWSVRELAGHLVFAHRTLRESLGRSSAERPLPIHDYVRGYRPNAGEHSTGQAVDFMISSQSQGDAIAAFVQNHVSEFNVRYIIWRQRYWEPGSSWDLMEDRGSITQNHYDHVHVTVD